jgi:hypothetical protein
LGISVYDRRNRPEDSLIVEKAYRTIVCWSDV